MLKFAYNSESEVPAEHKSLYSKNDQGKWTLQVEGAVEPAKLEEALNTTRTLQREKEEIEKKAKETTDKFKDVDLDKYKQLIDQTEKTGAKDGNFEGIINSLQKQIKDIQELRAQDKARADRLTVESTLVEQANKAGVRPEALVDVRNRINQTWKVADDGSLKAYEGDKAILNESATPITPEQWYSKMKTESSYLFKVDTGTGANGSGGNKPTSDPNVKIVPKDTKLTAEMLQEMAEGKLQLDHS